MKTLKIRNTGVEQWLKNVEEAMILTLQKKIKDAAVNYLNIDRKEWVLSHCGQAVATIAQVTWTSDSEMYISEMSVNPFSLQDYFDVNKSQLQQLTELIRGNLTEL